MRNLDIAKTLHQQSKKMNDIIYRICFKNDLDEYTELALERIKAENNQEISDLVDNEIDKKLFNQITKRIIILFVLNIDKTFQDLIFEKENNSFKVIPDAKELFLIGLSKLCTRYSEEKINEIFFIAAIEILYNDIIKQCNS